MNNLKKNFIKIYEFDNKVNLEEDVENNFKKSVKYIEEMIKKKKNEEGLKGRGGRIVRG